MIVLGLTVDLAIGNLTILPVNSFQKDCITMHLHQQFIVYCMWVTVQYLGMPRHGAYVVSLNQYVHDRENYLISVYGLEAWRKTPELELLHTGVYPLIEVLQFTVRSQSCTPDHIRKTQHMTQIKT